MSYLTARDAWSELVRRLDAWSISAAAEFVLRGWEWMMLPGESRVPTAQEIHNCAYNLAWAALREIEKDQPLKWDSETETTYYLKPQHSCVSSGRLEARFACYEGRWTATISIPLHQMHVS